MVQLPRSVSAALLGFSLTCASTAYADGPGDPRLNTQVANVEQPAQSTRLTRPLSLTLGAGFPDAARLGVEYNLGRFFSIGANAGTAGIFRDYGVHARVYPFDTHRFHFYAQGGVDALDLTPLSPNAATVIVPNLRIGEEFRAENGFTAGLNVGVGAPVTGVSRAPVPAVSLYLGWSF